jgi:hypothetical protein
MAYTVEFIRVPPEDMQQVGLAVLYRSGDRTVIYCRADHISAELAQSLTDQGTRFSQVTIRYDHPVSSRERVRFIRVDPAEMPDSVAPHVSTINGDELVSYYRADMITEEMAHALEVICAEETRYLVRLPVISPAVPGASASGQ